MITYVRSITRVLLKTALAALVPFIPALISDPASNWQVAVFTVALAVVIAAVTALVSLPDLSGEGWIAASLAKALRQFGQMIIAATAGAVLITDVDWPTILKAGAVSALTTLIIAAVDSLGKVDDTEVDLLPLEEDAGPSLAYEDEVGSHDPLLGRGYGSNS
jgi:hypothetical protein